MIHVGMDSQERLDFLKRHGWREDMTADEKKKLEAYWTDADIEMANALNLA